MQTLGMEPIKGQFFFLNAKWSAELSAIRCILSRPRVHAGPAPSYKETAALSFADRPSKKGMVRSPLQHGTFPYLPTALKKHRPLMAHVPLRVDALLKVHIPLRVHAPPKMHSPVKMHISCIRATPTPHPLNQLWLQATQMAPEAEWSQKIRKIPQSYGAGDCEEN